MAKGTVGVVSAASVRRFAAAIRKTLLEQSLQGPLELDEPDAGTAAALNELSDAVDQVAGADRQDGVLFVPESRTAALLMSFLSAQAAEAAGSAEDALEVELAKSDVEGWVTKFVPAWISGRFNKRPFVPPSPAAIRIGDDVRVA